MKILLSAILLASVSAFAQDQKVCTLSCTENGKPSFGAEVSEVMGNFIFTNSRGYGTWSTSCEVMDPNGDVVYESSISGAVVTQVASQSQQKPGGGYPGSRLVELRKKKKANLTEELTHALENCNQSL